MELLPTIPLTWDLLTNPGLSTTLAYAGPFASSGADQLGMLISVNTATANAYFRVAWGGMDDAGTGVDTIYGQFEECVESPGEVVSGILQRYSLLTKEYGPIAPGRAVVIWLPIAAHFFWIGCYTDVTPTTGDSVTAGLELARTGTPFQQQ
jgi:hypothetical protein